MRINWFYTGLRHLSDRSTEDSGKDCYGMTQCTTASTMPVEVPITEWNQTSYADE